MMLETILVNESYGRNFRTDMRESISMSSSIPIIVRDSSVQQKNLYDKPGVLFERYGPLVERIDCTKDEPILKYDLYGVGKKEQKDLFGSHYSDFHHKKL